MMVLHSQDLIPQFTYDTNGRVTRLTYYNIALFMIEFIYGDNGDIYARQYRQDINSVNEPKSCWTLPISGIKYDEFRHVIDYYHDDYFYYHDGSRTPETFHYRFKYNNHGNIADMEYGKYVLYASSPTRTECLWFPKLTMSFVYDKQDRICEYRINSFYHDTESGYIIPLQNKYQSTTTVSIDYYGCSDIVNCITMQTNTDPLGGSTIIYRGEEITTPVMKIFLSHKMSGISEDEVLQIRSNAITKLREKYGDNISIIDNYHHDNAPENAGRLWHLGRSIQQLEDADAIYFCDLADTSNGVVVEMLIAKFYHLKVLNSDFANYIDIKDVKQSGIDTAYKWSSDHFTHQNTFEE